MNCQRCGSKVEKGWSFCPRCGSILSGDVFGEVFSRLRKEIAEMNKLFEKEIEAFDISPWFKDIEKKKVVFHPRSSGFAIKIVQSGSGKPVVSVKTFGDVDNERLKREIEKFGVWQPDFGKEKSGVRVNVSTPNEQQRELKMPSFTEEPKTSVLRTGSKVVVEMELPGVDSEKNIEISELENSVEVKAFAGDRAYFKILTKPPQFTITKKLFDKGRLHMEFS
ncbi:MAG: zinc-ribbon domain-containing protein [Candidatus Aenigmatarchaeota archaeon]